jgi:parvulin-like peptidyl-prolyl isomerase
LKRILAAVGMALVASTVFAQVDNNRTVVTINGEDVKGGEYYRRMEYLPDVGRVLEGGSVAVYPPGFLTIVQLIDERLVLQLAKQKGVSPTQEEVNQAIQESMAADSKLMERWMSMGRTEDELKYQFRYQVAQFKLQTQGVNVSDQEVDQFYAKTPPMIPRRVTLRMIAVADEAGEKAVDADLAGGKAFADVAKERSIDVTQSVSGAVGTVPIDMLPSEVTKAVDTTKIGQMTDWIKGNTFYVKYLIEGKAQPEKIPLDSGLRNRLRRKLMLDRGAAKNNVLREISDMRKSATVDIKQKEFADIYQSFVRTYLKG